MMDNNDYNNNSENNYTIVELNNAALSSNDKPRILKLLEGHPDGLTVLSYYKANKILDKNTRNLLGRIIINHEHEGTQIVNCISASRFTELAREICQCFSNEVEGTYYVPYSNASGGGSAQRARGILLACNSYKRSSHLKKVKSLTQTISIQTASAIETTNDPSESFIFIKKYIEPWETVVGHWINSYSERQKEFDVPNFSIKDYFNKFSCLKQTQGYVLLENDFDLKFPEKKNAFKENWPVVRKQLIHLFCGPRKPAEPEFRSLALSLEFLKDDTLDLALFLLLSAAFPKPRSISNKTEISNSKNKKRIRKEKSDRVKGWNPTKSEAQGGFIFNVKTANDVFTSLDQLKKTLAAHNLPLQPRPVIVGCVNNIISSHVFINDTFYDFGSVSRAVEVAFKIYYALNAHYPPEGKLAWLFIEQAIFKLNIKHELPTPTSVTTLVGELAINFNSDSS